MAHPSPRFAPFPFCANRNCCGMIGSRIDWRELPGSASLTTGIPTQAGVISLGFCVSSKLISLRCALGLSPLPLVLEPFDLGNRDQSTQGSQQTG